MMTEFLLLEFDINFHNVRNWRRSRSSPTNLKVQGHAITINNTLYLNKMSADDSSIIEYNCSGTPVGVKLAGMKFFRKPDLWNWY